MLTLHPKKHTLLEFVEKPVHDHKTTNQSSVCPIGNTNKKRLFGAHKGLKGSQENRVLVVKMALQKAGIFFLLK